MERMMGETARITAGTIKLRETVLETLGLVNHAVIAETIWVLSRQTKCSRATIAAIVERIFDAHQIRMHDADVVRAALHSFKRHPGDVADHPIGEINSRNGCSTTFTFDRAAARSPLFSELSR
ncbi:PIN domain-containing protein [Rhizobium sp. YIM 134829]|uniref:PIN domain-containing protein n=1 Tax=Rhizobium sp. YIM 134829 TaxID=3390453 RepID=UPI00397B61D1